MVKTIKKYIPFLICAFVSLMYSLMGPLAKIGIPTKLLTLVIYVPFIVCYALFLRTTFHSWRLSPHGYWKQHPDRMLILVFSAYCVFLLVFRYVTKLSYLNGLHFAARTLGAIGICYVVLGSEEIRRHLSENMMLYAFFLDIAVLVDLSLTGSFRVTKVLTNVLVVCCVIFILDLVCIKYLYFTTQAKPFYQVVCFVTFAVTGVITFLSGSRTVLFLGPVLLVCILLQIIFLFHSKKYLLLFLSSLVASGILLFGLFIGNFGDTRPIISKQLSTIHISAGTSASNSSVSCASASVHTSSKTPSAHSSSATASVPSAASSASSSALSKSQQSKEFQYGSVETLAERSDSMRNDLHKLGIREVKKNLLLGTGNVYFDYTISIGVVQQTPHNVFLETLIAFGAVGLVLLLLFAVFLLLPLLRSSKVYLYSKISCLIMLAIIMAFACFQQMFYNYMVLILLFLSIADIRTPEQKMNF